MGTLRGWIDNKFKVNDGVERTVFDESGYLYQRNEKIEMSKSQIGEQRIQSVLFTEAGAGTYTGTIALPAGAIIVDVIITAGALWAAATSAAMIVGDGTDPNGFFDAINLKATDLLAGESINFCHTGGKQGADVDAPSTATHIRRRWLAAARNVIGVITSVGAGTTGRTYMTVVYTVPVLGAAVKS